MGATGGELGLAFGAAEAPLAPNMDPKIKMSAMDEDLPKFFVSIPILQSRRRLSSWRN